MIIFKKRHARKTRYAMYEALEALGGTRHEVARTLEDLGITGKRWRASSCPIANYMAFMGFKGSAGMNSYVSDGVAVSVPVAVSGFIMDFDSGLFAHYTRTLVDA